MPNRLSVLYDRGVSGACDPVDGQRAVSTGPSASISDGQDALALDRTLPGPHVWLRLPIRRVLFASRE